MWRNTCLAIAAYSLIGFGTHSWAQRPREEVAIELIQRWDTNRDGVLTSAEVPARARPTIERISREAGLKLEDGLPLERVSQLLRRQSSTADRQSADRAPDRSSEGADSNAEAPGDDGPKPVEQERIGPPGFGSEREGATTRGFGNRGPSTPSTSPSQESKQSDGAPSKEPTDGQQPDRPKPDDRVRRYAEALLRRYDRNRNGMLEKEEWSRMRGDPARSDTNKDGILTVDELAVQLSAYGRSNRITSQPRAAASTAEPRPADGNRTSRSSPRFTTATERIAEILPRELLDWFLQKDRDGDGQVAMSEFSSAWTLDRMREFTQLDLDNDGLITPREYTKAKTGR